MICFNWRIFDVSLKVTVGQNVSHLYFPDGIVLATGETLDGVESDAGSVGHDVMMAGTCAGDVMCALAG